MFFKDWSWPFKRQTHKMVKHTQTIRLQFADKLFEYVKTILWGWYLNLVSAIFYQIIIFSSNDRPSRTMKNVFYFI